MRTQGSLRLILNTKLWPQMQVDKASEKSVRITAMDTEDQGVKVFLISVCVTSKLFHFQNDNLKDHNSWGFCHSVCPHLRVALRT